MRRSESQYDKKEVVRELNIVNRDPQGSRSPCDEMSNMRMKKFPSKWHEVADLSWTNWMLYVSRAIITS